MSRLFLFILPEMILLVGAFLILGADYGIWRGSSSEGWRRRAVFGVAQIILFLAIIVLGVIASKLGLESTAWQSELFKLNAGLAAFKIFLLLLTWGSLRLASKENIRQSSERAALFMLGAVGMCVVVSSYHLLLLFVGLETFAISVYALAVLGKKEPEAVAAGFQFFVSGSVAAAFFFYGMGLLNGVTHSLYFGVIQSVSGLASSPMAAVALGALMVGVGFKLAAAPFHFWAPDFYRSAPASVTAWVAGASKALGAYLLMIVWLLFHRGESFSVSTREILLILSALSLVAGTFGALRQTHLGRLMAFGSVAHAGYLLMATQATTVHGGYAMLYHALTYAPAALTVFWVLSLLPDMNLETLAGLSRKSPAAAIYLSIAVLSLAGIPPLGGFFGKYYLFAASVATYPFLGKNYWLLALALLMAAIGLYYYLQILRRIWVSDSSEAMVSRLSFGDHLLLGLLQVITIGLGLVPELVIRLLAKI